MFCPKCGNELSDVAAFCNKCGYAVKEGNSSENKKKNIEEKQKKGVMWGILLLAVCIFGSVGIFLLYQWKYIDKIYVDDKLCHKIIYDFHGNVVKEIDYDTEGNIQELYEYKYVYDGQGNIIKETKYDSEMNLLGAYEYEYGSQGNQVKMMEYDSEMNLLGTYEYEYDSQGNQVKSTEYDLDGNIEKWYEYEYDSKGNSVKEIEYEWLKIEKYLSYVEADDMVEKDALAGYEHTIGWTACEYDDQGNAVKRTDYNLDGGISKWDGYEYDNQGNMVKWTAYNPDNSIKGWNEYEYDSQGNMIEEMEFKSDGSVRCWHEFEYNTHGNMINETGYNSEGNIEWWCNYEYDGQSNIVKVTAYNSEGNVEWWKEYNDQGNIIKDGTQTWATTEYEYDSMGKLVKRVEYVDDSLHSWFMYEYDNRGNLIKRIASNDDYEKYEYDYQGNLIRRMEKYTTLSSRGISEEYVPYTSELEYAYDSQGNIVKETWRHCGEGRENGYENKYEYDSEGKLVTETEYDLEGNIESWSEFKYDSQGKLVTETEYDSERNIESWREVEYDGQGNRVTETEYDLEGNMERYAEYDGLSNLVKEIVFTDDEHFKIDSFDKGYGSEYVEYITECRSQYRIDEYEYDIKGNKVRDVTYSIDSSYNSVHESEYNSRGDEVIGKSGEENTTYSFVGNIAGPGEEDGDYVRFVETRGFLFIKPTRVVLETLYGEKILVGRIYEFPFPINLTGITGIEKGVLSLYYWVDGKERVIRREVEFTEE